MVKIAPTEAHRVAGDIKNCATWCTDSNRALNKHMRHMQGKWRGDAQIRYAAWFDKRVKLLRTIADLLRATSQAVTKIALAAEKADQEGTKVAPTW